MHHKDCFVDQFSLLVRYRTAFSLTDSNNTKEQAGSDERDVVSLLETDFFSRVYYVFKGILCVESERESSEERH